jgi:hypothetical protein
MLVDRPRILSHERTSYRSLFLVRTGPQSYRNTDIGGGDNSSINCVSFTNNDRSASINNGR